MAETQYSLRIVKTFAYRGDPVQTWSNRYFFDGGDPGDSATWHDLFDAFVLVEKTCYPNSVTVADVYGYAPGSQVAVASKSYGIAGTLGGVEMISTPGDCAAVLRMATTKRSKKNHPVYVFSYFHKALFSPSGSGPDELLAQQKTALENFGSDLLNGITVNTRTYKRTTPDGHPTTGRAVDPWIGHRDFLR